MESNSTLEHTCNGVMTDRRPHTYALITSRGVKNWPERAEGRSCDRDLSLPKAISLDPVRILIVADLAASMQIAMLVHSIGRFHTRIACSAEPALNIACDFLPGIVLMSTDLPDLASYRLASTLRWQSSLRSLRLIALTDDIPGNDRRRALTAGFEQYLTLPVQQTALESVVLVPHFGRHPR